MIDWLTVSGPYSGRLLPRGRVTLTDEHGEVEKEYGRPRRVEGSHDSSVGVVTPGNGTIWIDGNPAKLFQGHNVFGSSEVLDLAALMFLWVVDHTGLDPADSDLIGWGEGDVNLTRVDVTFSTALGSRARVLETLKAFASATISGRKLCQPSLAGGTTIYWGKHSRTWALKLYSKGNELADRGHRLPPAIAESDHGPLLLEHADGLLRQELVLRGPDLLRSGLRRASDWTYRGTREIHHERFGRLVMPAERTTLDTDELLESMPSRLRAIAYAHLAGRDTRRLCSRATWFRHRKALLEHGIDLASREPDPEFVPSNVAPIQRERIDITPNYHDEIPSWAYGTGLAVDTRTSAFQRACGLPCAPLEYGRRFPALFPEEASLAACEELQDPDPDA